MSTATITHPASTTEANTATTPLTPVVIDTRTRTPWARIGSTRNWLAYAVTAVGLVVAGDVWIGTDGAWFAYRADTDTDSGPAADRTEAMRAVGWLSTARAGDLVDMVRAAHMAGVDGVRVVMPDGRHAVAYAARHLPRPDGSPLTVDPVDVSLYFDDDQAEAMAHPRPVNAGAVASAPGGLAEADGTRRPGVRLILPGSTPVALVA